MKRFLILIFLTAGYVLNAQNNISLDIKGGIDYSKLLPINDSLEVEPRTSPYFGLSANFPTDNNHEFQTGIVYQMKASMDEMHIKYRSIGLGLFGKYQYCLLNRIWLNVGAQYTIPIKSYALLPIYHQYLRGAKEVKIKKYASYFSLSVGFKVQLNKRLFFDMAYEYPVNNPYLSKFPSIKAGISIRIDKNDFKFEKQKVKKEQSKALIKQFKKTALLVSLPSYKHQINQYKKNGNTKVAKRIINKRDERNRTLMEAFRKHFDFCPVYFFYNDDTEKVRAKDLNGIFVNSDLEKDPSIQLDDSLFLVGKLGYSVLHQSDNKSYTDVYKNGYNLAEGYTQSGVKDSDYSNYGFTMVNQDFKLMPKPFPSHTRGYFLFMKLSEDKIVTKLNQNLHRFYNKSNLK